MYRNNATAIQDELTSARETRPDAGRAAPTSALRGMSYADGVAALAPSGPTSGAVPQRSAPAPSAARREVAEGEGPRGRGL